MIQSSLGLLALFGLAYLFSEDRSRINWRLVLSGMALQFALAALLLKAPGSRGLFLGLNTLVDVLEQATMAGTGFVFGYLGGAPLPFPEPSPGAAYIFAFRSLPLVIVIAALSAAGFHLGILQRVVAFFAWVLKKTMGVDGALGVAASATVYLGMIEAPLLVKPYLVSMRRDELFAMMTTGMACIAGTVLVLYSAILSPVVPDAIGHILTASVISAPCALVMAALLVPGEAAYTKGQVHPKSPYTSIMDALSHGVADGMQLLLGIVAMLVCFVALVKLANLGFALLPDVHGAPVSLERILGLLMSPLALCLGIPLDEVLAAGSLLGTKTVINEFVAYLQLAATPANVLSERSRILLTYAMCGFANPGSLGILIGALGGMCPERRGEVVALGWKAVAAGTLTSVATGAVAGILL